MSKFLRLSVALALVGATEAVRSGLEVPGMEVEDIPCDANYCSAEKSKVYCSYAICGQCDECKEWKAVPLDENDNSDYMLKPQNQGSALNQENPEPQNDDPIPLPPGSDYEKAKGMFGEGTADAIFNPTPAPALPDWKDAMAMGDMRLKDGATNNNYGH